MLPRATITALVLLLAGATIARAQSAETVPTDEGLVAVMCGTFLSTEVVARFGADSTVYVPFAAFCDLFAVKHRTIGADTLIAEVPTGSPFTIVRSTHTLHRGDSAIRLEDASILGIDGVAYAEISAISRAFGLTFEYDPRNVRIFVSPDRRLPFVTNELGERRREALGVYSSGTGDSSVAASVDRRLLGMPVVDWGFDWSMRRDVVDAGGGFRFGMPALFGSLSGSGSANLEQEERPRIVAGLDEVRWEFALPYFAPLRRVELSTSTQLADRTFGAKLSNTSLSTRRTDGIAYSISGHTQPDWIVELYDGAELLQATQADSNGYYEFSTPLDRSNITYVVHQVGPHGERIATERLVERPIDLLLGGAIEYDLSASSTLRSGAPFEGQAVLQAGVTEWLTLGSRERLRPSTPGDARIDSLEHRPFANVWLGASGSLSLEYDPNPGMARATLDIPIWGDLRCRLDGIEVANDLSRYGAGTSINVALGPMMLGTTARYENHSGASVFKAKPTISGFFHGISFSASSSLQWMPKYQTTSETADTVPNGPVESSLNLVAVLSPSIMIGGDVTYDHSTDIPSRMNLWSSLGLTSWLRVGASYRVDDLDWSRAGVELSLGLDFSLARLRSRTDRRGDVVSNRTSLEGSFVLTPTGIHTRNSTMVGQSAVVVRAFNDVNGNAEFDRGEQFVGSPRTSLRGGGGNRASDEGEHFSVMPDAEYIVEIDPYSFAADGYYPRRTRFMIYALPNTVQTIDVPLSAGSDLTGRLVLVDDTSAEIPMSSSVFNGLKVRARAVDGTASYDGEAFSDGSLFIIGVAPGEYRIELDERQLAMRRIRLRGEPRTYVVGADAPSLEPIRLERAPEP